MRRLVGLEAPPADAGWWREGAETLMAGALEARRLETRPGPVRGATRLASTSTSVNRSAMA